MVVYMTDLKAKLQICHSKKKEFIKLKKVFFKCLLTTLVLLMVSLCAFSASVAEVKQNIIDQANEMGVDPAIVLSIAKVESGFNQAAKGPGGHVGVFQLSPDTARLMGLDPYDLDDNIKGGITYYKKMYDKFGSIELATAAYNLGPEAIRRHNNTVPHNTKKFVSMVMYYYNIYNKQEP